MAKQQAKELAKNMRDHSRREAQRHGRGLRYGVVRALEPISIEITDANLLLDASDIVLGQTVRAYAKGTPLKKGDTLALAPMSNGEWVAVDVLGEEDPKATEGALNTLLHGEGPPPEELGNPGDFYIDTEGMKIYGPKT